MRIPDFDGVMSIDRRSETPAKTPEVRKMLSGFDGYPSLSNQGRKKYS
jgi:hypothetical protein